MACGATAQTSQPPKPEVIVSSSSHPPQRPRHIWGVDHEDDARVVNYFVHRITVEIFRTVAICFGIMQQAQQQISSGNFPAVPEVCLEPETIPHFVLSVILQRLRENGVPEQSITAIRDGVVQKVKESMMIVIEIQP